MSCIGVRSSALMLRDARVPRLLPPTIKVPARALRGRISRLSRRRGHDRFAPGAIALVSHGVVSLLAPPYEGAQCRFPHRRSSEAGARALLRLRAWESSATAACRSVAPGHDDSGLVGEDDGLNGVAQLELHEDPPEWVLTVFSLR